MKKKLIRIEKLVELLGETSKQAVYNKLNRGVLAYFTDFGPPNTIKSATLSERSDAGCFSLIQVADLGQG